jgi:hypothetical protein
MKKFITSLLIISLAIPAFPQGKKERAAKEEIEKLIKKEITAFLNKDWEEFQKCWLHEPYTRHFVTSKSAFNGRIGWENMQNLISKSFEIDGPRGFTTSKTDIDIQVFGEAAYATLREQYQSTNPDDPWVIEALNNAFFAKRDGEWKFVCMNIVNTSSFEDANRYREIIQDYLETISGRAKTREMFLRYISDKNESLIRQNIAVEQAFPMYELRANEILVDGNRVIVYGKFRGVQHGRYGDIAPTGNEVKLEVVLGYTLENGKITSHTVSYDNASMLEQLGARN